MFTQLRHDFFLPDALSDQLIRLDSIPEVFTQHGKPKDNLDGTTHWMTYAFPGDDDISFCRNTRVLFPEIVDFTARYLSLIPGLSVFPERICFIRTKGKVRKHRDEALRLSAINIGVSSANASITRFAATDDDSKFDESYYDFQCKNGGVYLLDTSRPHAVLPLWPESNRLLLTMTLTEPYSVVNRRLLEARNQSNLQR